MPASLMVSVAGTVVVVVVVAVDGVVYTNFLGSPLSLYKLLIFIDNVLLPFRTASLERWWSPLDPSTLFAATLTPSTALPRS